MVLVDSGCNVPTLSAMAVRTTGVYLGTRADLTDWLAQCRSSGGLSPDPLGYLVLGTAEGGD